MTDPIVHVANHANLPVCISHDPNWDDQVLLIGGRPEKRTLCLAPGTQTNVSIRLGADSKPDENLMGVIFTDAKDVEHGKTGMHQTTVGHHAETGLLSVTDEATFGTPALRYSVSNQTQWSMDMTFVDS